MRKTLLSVGTNHSLLGLRNKVLAEAGYTILTAKSGATALVAIRSLQLDAVILGHSLSLPIRAKVFESAKRESLPVIVLHAYAYEARFADAYANLCGIDGAATILDVLRDLFADYPQTEHVANLGPPDANQGKPRRKRPHQNPVASVIQLSNHYRMWGTSIRYEVARNKPTSPRLLPIVATAKRLSRTPTNGPNSSTSYSE